VIPVVVLAIAMGTFSGISKSNGDGEKAVHHFHIGYMTIDGTQWEKDGVTTKATIYDNRKHIAVWDYKDGDMVSISANWTIIKDKIGPWREPPYGQSPEWHLTCEEMWNFTIILYDKFNSMIDRARVSINDSVWDESGKSGVVYLNCTFPRSDFYYDNPQVYKIEIRSEYYRWCWKPFDHWGDFSDPFENHDFADLTVYFTGPNSAPEILYTSSPPEKCKFDQPVTFTVKADDGDGDPVRFLFDWDGDGFNEWEGDTSTDWFEDLPAEITIKHTWKKENYPGERKHVARPKVMVIDKLGASSGWIDLGEITLPLTQSNSLDKEIGTINILERFPILKQFVSIWNLFSHLIEKMFGSFPFLK